MTKADLVEKMSDDTGLSKADAGRSLDAMLDGIKKGLKQGHRITLSGFGTFLVVKRKARVGRNPRTGEEIKIAASKAPKFVPGNALKEVVK